MARVFIGVGSNIDPARNLRAALSALARELRLLRLSTVYRTAALGERSHPDFYNGVVEVETDLGPEPLRRRLHGIEDALGRVRTGDPWSPRAADLDLLLVAEGGRVDAATLQPSPELAERRFVAAALAELRPELVMPDGRRVADLAAAAPAWPMAPLCDYTERLRAELLPARGAGPTLEEFAAEHGLPPRWLEARRRLVAIVRDPQFWYRRSLQAAAAPLVSEASEILRQTLSGRARP